MVGKSKPATASESARMDLIGSQAFGCVPCRLDDPFMHVLATVQHVTEGYRVGHDATYGACVWHHFGDPPQRKGPSLANGMRPYQYYYGSEALLVQLQDWLLDQYTADPWLEYAMPFKVARQLHARWVTLRSDDTHFGS